MSDMDYPGVAQDARAIFHREQALERVNDGDALLALVHAVLALEARVDEQTDQIINNMPSPSV